MAACYCGKQIGKTDRRVVAAIFVDWGAHDLRENQAAKTSAFCSFQCLADWAKDRADEHDDRVLQEGNPDDVSTAETPRVDTTTDTLIRKD